MAPTKIEWCVDPHHETACLASCQACMEQCDPKHRFRGSLDGADEALEKRKRMNPALTRAEKELET